MKNFEKYEKEIKKIGVDDICVTFDTKKVVKCEGYCSICLFYKANDNFGQCNTRKTRWLYKEAK